MKDKYKIIIPILVIISLIPFMFIIPDNPITIFPSDIINSTCLDCDRNLMNLELIIISILFPISIIIVLMVFFLPIKEKSCKDTNKNNINLE